MLRLPPCCRRVLQIQLYAALVKLEAPGLVGEVLFQIVAVLFHLVERVPREIQLALDRHNRLLQHVGLVAQQILDLVVYVLAREPPPPDVVPRLREHKRHRDILEVFAELGLLLFQALDLAVGLDDAALHQRLQFRGLLDLAPQVLLREQPVLAPRLISVRCQLTRLVAQATRRHEQRVVVVQIPPRFCLPYVGQLHRVVRLPAALRQILQRLLPRQRVFGMHLDHVADGLHELVIHFDVGLVQHLGEVHVAQFARGFIGELLVGRVDAVALRLLEEPLVVEAARGVLTHENAGGHRWRHVPKEYRSLGVNRFRFWRVLGCFFLGKK
mmetsp:Transcript_38455/g.64646  ORF Transcript_38455/g.64646 Transcript_38455/m.64646 type:complete len:327 (-) Transcript_38455:620-1600(-)